MLSSGTEGLKISACILISGIFLMLQTFTAQAEEASTAPVDDSYARSIVEKADLVRFPPEGFQVDIVINTSQPDKQVEMRKYRVLQKGNENTVVMVTEPASERGQIILMKGRDLWVFMPEVFLKPLTIARNLHDGRPTHFTTCDLDMHRHYRPRMNVVQRPVLTGGQGFEITGHHEIMVPLLAWAIASRLIRLILPSRR